MKRRVHLKILIAIVTFLIAICLFTGIARAIDDIIVMLDPGHGGSDSGASYGGIREKDVNWKLATYVKEILDQTPGITGILTRSENECPSLYDRGLKAKSNNANLLVSFHINSNDHFNNLSGAETYITGDTNSYRFHQASKDLANRVLGNLRSIGVRSHNLNPIVRYSTDGELYSDGFLSDYYGIIRNPMYYGIPGVLLEHCFINNPSDRQNFLSSDDKIRAMAQQDAKAIIDSKEAFRIDQTKNAITSQVLSMGLHTNADKADYIAGEILEIEWINGMQTIPTTLPTIYLKSTDGSVKKKCYTYKKEGNKYYFDTFLSGMDKTKTYVIEVESNNKKQIPTNYLSNPSMQDANLVNSNGIRLQIRNNNIRFADVEYKGAINTDVKEINMGRNGNGAHYIYGNLLIAEWIDGVANVPSTMPKLTLKSTDGSYSQGVYSYHQGGLSYYFDTYVENLDPNKTYYIEAELTNLKNTLEKARQIQTLKYADKNLGMAKDYQVKLQNNNLIFKGSTYEGAINTDVKEINMGRNGDGAHYIYGNLLIAEWIDGVANVPSTMPKLTLKSTDGSYSQGVYSYHQGGLSYYFDTYVENLDPNKTYYIEAELTNPKNTLEKTRQIQTLKYYNKKLGIVQDFKVEIIHNMITFKENTYEGTIKTTIQSLDLGQNGDEVHYIYGNLSISEWVDGVENIPSMMPKLTLKSTDGSYIQELYRHHQGGLNYYFDGYIETLDKTKTYYIEAELTNPKNTLDKIKQTEKLRLIDKQLGIMENYNVKIQDKNLIFESIQIETKRQKSSYQQEEQKPLENTQLDDTNLSNEPTDEIQENQTEDNKEQVNQSDEKPQNQT